MKKENNSILGLLTIVLIGIIFCLYVKIYSFKCNQKIQESQIKKQVNQFKQYKMLTKYKENNQQPQASNQKNLVVHEKLPSLENFFYAKQYQNRPYFKINQKLKQNTIKNQQILLKVQTAKKLNKYIELQQEKNVQNKNQKIDKIQKNNKNQNKKIDSNTLEVSRIDEKNKDQMHVKPRLEEKILQVIKNQQALNFFSMSRQHLSFSKNLLSLKSQPLNSELAQQQKYYYDKKYNISGYSELPICVIVPSYKNADKNRYLNNINSILQQDYANFRIIFFDDASDDNTWELINKFKSEHRVSDQKLKLVHNQKREMALGNIYKAANLFCEPYEIFIIVDGDDELVGKQVFKHFNSLFQSKNMWLVYSNFLMGPLGSAGFSHAYDKNVIQTNSFRAAGFVISHLRAFYTKLFRLIKEQDLKDENGNWYRAANDVAILYPVLQMVQRKHMYSAEISYFYNSNTGLNNHHTKTQQQLKNTKKIKQKQLYKPLQELFNQEEKKMQKQHTGLIIPIIDTSMSQYKIQQINKFGWEK